MGERREVGRGSGSQGRRRHEDGVGAPLPTRHPAFERAQGHEATCPRAVACRQRHWLYTRGRRALLDPPLPRPWARSRGLLRTRTRRHLFLGLLDELRRRALRVGGSFSPEHLLAAARPPAFPGPPPEHARTSLGDKYSASSPASASAPPYKTSHDASSSARAHPCLPADTSHRVW
jgi:hypothetical protein